MKQFLFLAAILGVSACSALPNLPHSQTPSTGQVLFYSSRSGNANQIFSMKLDGSGVEQLTKGEATSYNPSWSKDGSQVLYSSRLKNQYDVMLTGTNDSAPVNLTNNASHDDF